MESQAVKVDLSTPPSARNMDVIYEEVQYGAEDDFLITDTSNREKAEDISSSVQDATESEDQFMFTFDFPINKKEEVKPNTQDFQNNQKPVQKSQSQKNNRVVHDLNDTAKDLR